MRLAMRIPPSGQTAKVANDTDPREEVSPDVTDLANRVAYPVVGQRKGKSDGFGLAAGILVVTALGAVTLWSMNAARMEPPQGIGTQEARPPQKQPVVIPPEAATTPASPLPAAPPIAAPPPANATTPATTAVPATNPYASPTLVFDTSAVTGLEAAEAAATAGASDTQTGTGNSASEFASRIGGVGGAPAQAKAMVNPQTTVTQGTLIPAILETAIDTNVPGYVRAVVSQDVRSFDGSRVLVPRSSRLIGQYQSGLQGGQKRAYVIWTRLIRPDGASVNLASPAIGFDGTTGLEGKVKSNFFKRFGSSILLSVVGGLTAAASGGASVILGGGSSAAAAAAQQDGQIGPTVRVRQGEPIRIFTARDLDFSQVTSD